MVTPYRIYSSNWYYEFDSRRKTWNNGVLAGDSIFPYRVTGPRSRTTAHQVPGWRLRKAHGENATTYMSATKQASQHVRPYLYLKRNNFGTIQETEITNGIFRVGFPASPPAADLALAQTRAISEFISKARSVTRSLQGIVLVGEIGESLRMLKSPAKTLRRAIDSYRNRNRRLLRIRDRTARRTAITDSWLEASFGWAPFINDIHDAGRVIADFSTYAAPYKYISTKLGSARSGGSQTTSLDNDMLSSWKYDIITDFESTVTYRGVIHNIVDGFAAGNRRANDLIGFRWEDALPSAWELVPYSFLIDYFTNVGDIISCLSFNRTNVRWASRTTRSIGRSRTANFIWSTGPETTTQRTISKHLNPGSVVMTTSSVSRATYEGEFLPDFIWQLPGFGSSRWLNIAALVNGKIADSSIAHFRA